MAKGKQPNRASTKQNSFAGALPAFDKAMRKIVAVPKTEVERRAAIERSNKESQK